MSSPLKTLSSAVLFLFFMQLISEFVEAVYAFGLLGTSIPAEIVSVLFLLVPFLLILVPSRFSDRMLAAAGLLVLAAGAAEMWLDTRGRMLAAGVGTAGFLLYFPLLLGREARKGAKQAHVDIGSGLALGLALFILFRAWNSGLYPYALIWFRALTIFLATVGAAGLILPWRQEVEGPPDDPTGEPSPVGLGRISLLGLGIYAAWVLLYFAFGSPNVIASWAGAQYGLVVGWAAVALALFAAIQQGNPAIQWLFKKGPLAIWNLAFLIAMVASILPHQVRFPPSPNAYPLPEPPAGPLALPALFLMVVLFPVVLLDFMLFTKEIIDLRARQRTLGAAFGFGGFFLLIMIFGQVFTTVYAYIPVIGPAFRDRFWLIFLITGLALALPLLIAGRLLEIPRHAVSKQYSVVLIALAALTIAGAILPGANPPLPAEEQNVLRILTYNIQQGYSEYGDRNPLAQLALMRRFNPDIIGLQESDTNRIAGGNADVVRYFADQLDMYSYYGPKVVPGTLGIALLSRYPIDDPRTFYLFSEGEQVAAIHARIPVGGVMYHVFVTHLGNGGPIVQQEEFLQEIDGLENVIAMGDFNFRPDSPQYELTTGLLSDAWLVKWPGGVDNGGENASGRIDHVFVSRGIDVREARYIDDPASDHPALFVELGR